MVERSAEALAKNAAGRMKPKHLTSTGGLLSTYLYDQPLLDYLREDEQPQYLFSHGSKGFRTVEPNGSESTPHHGLEGKSFLLVTDQRVLYVAGCEDGDEHIELPYHRLKEVTEHEAQSRCIRLQTIPGIEYVYPTFLDDVGPAIEYAADRIAAEDRRLESLANSDGVVAVLTANVETYPRDVEESSVPFPSGRTVFQFTDAEVLASDSKRFEYATSLAYSDVVDAEFFRAVKHSGTGSYADVLRLIVDTPGSDSETHVTITGNQHRNLNGKTVYASTASRFPTEDLEQVARTISNATRDRSANGSRLVANEWFEVPLTLRIEGWNKGSSYLDAGLSGSGASEGKSKSVQVGPFSRGKTTSESTITADINGSISDNTYSSQVEYLELSEDGILAVSDPVLELGYDEIDSVMKRDRSNDASLSSAVGIQITSGETTYSMTGFPRDNVVDCLAFVRERIADSSESSEDTDDPYEKLRKLEDLRSDGILSDEEFQAKKEEFLDEL